jgi:acetyltransferase-like isoleucine patch superfamily enzyme
MRLATAPVVIGDHAFVGLNVSILPGSRIGRGAIVDSGTVVAGDVPPFARYGGSPGRVRAFRLPAKANPGPLGS